MDNKPFVHLVVGGQRHVIMARVVAVTKSVVKVRVDGREIAFSRRTGLPVGCDDRVSMTTGDLQKFAVGTFDDIEI